MKSSNMALNCLVLSAILACFTPHIVAQLLFDDIFGDVNSCEESCEATFAQHTFEKAVNLGYCRRGCRLFTIINFVDEFGCLNETKHACAQACGEAYGDKDNKDSCAVGCSFQLPVIERRQKQLHNMEPMMPTFSPLLYVHNWYSNMVDKLSKQMSISWSFYTQSDNGQMIVIRSEPKFFVADEQGRWREESPSDYKTSNYIETNLAEVDNSATPNLKLSQVHAMERDVDELQPVAENQASYDWLSCISKKTGMPRLLLTGTVFVSAFVMIWICLSSAVTAPEHRVAPQPQKLSIFGDLEYLRDIGDKSLLAAYAPQEISKQAPPLPIKVKVERI
ncbi:hypothetical protein LSH36_16g12036 [Paralvinella palmiformis]|uniref:Transmembrane protein 59 n=1 Tax=Paralvinella palmiformis TaxID=53620 RepID=A0AAD9NFW5_9ANNE|nr:hypothetical protein LSH36_16g12036 [Paralvinella palmiformis]